MEFQELFTELINLKVVLNLENNKLKIKVPKEISIDHLVDDINKNKNKIIEILSSIQHTEQDLIRVNEKKEFYPLSSAQKRLYLLQQMDLESTAFNMLYVIPLGAEIKRSKIEEIFSQLISRHESFRTNFEVIEEEQVQRIHEQVEFKCE